MRLSGAIGAALCVAGVVFIAGDLVHHEEWGLAVNMFLQQHRTPNRDNVMLMVSALGFEIIPLVVTTLLWAGNWRSQRFSLQLLLSMFVVFFNISFLKIWFGRPRPFVNQEGLVDDDELDTGLREFSHPSGHATGVTVLWMMLADYFHGVPDRFSPTRVYCMLVMLATSFSRIYFGVHYPHDLYSGWLVGITHYWFSKHIMLPYVYGSYAAFDSARPSSPRDRLFPGRPVSPLICLALGAAMIALCLDRVSFEVRDNHRGLFLSIGGIVGLLLFTPYTQLTVQVGGSTSSDVVRIFLGLMILVPGFMVIHVYPYNDWTSLAVGLLTTFIVSIGAVLVFALVGLHNPGAQRRKRKTL